MPDDQVVIRKWREACATFAAANQLVAQAIQKMSAGTPAMPMDELSAAIKRQEDAKNKLGELRKVFQGCD